MVDRSIMHILYEAVSNFARETIRNGKTSKKAESMEEGLKKLFAAYGGYCNPNDLELKIIISKIEAGEPVNTESLLIISSHEKSRMASLMPARGSSKTKFFLKELKVLEKGINGLRIRELNELAINLSEIAKNFDLAVKEGAINFAEQFKVFLRIEELQALILHTANLSGRDNLPFYKVTPENETEQALYALYIDIYQIIMVQKSHPSNKKLRKFVEDLKKEVIVYRSKRMDNILQLLNDARVHIRTKGYEMELSIFEKLNAPLESKGDEQRESSEDSDDIEIVDIPSDEPLKNETNKPVEPTLKNEADEPKNNGVSLKVGKIDIWGFANRGLITSWNDNGSFIYVLEIGESTIDDRVFKDFSTYEELMLARENGSLDIGDVSLVPPSNRRGFRIADLPFKYYYLLTADGNFKSCKTDKRKLVMVSSKKQQLQKIVTAKYEIDGLLTIHEYSDEFSFQVLSPQVSHQIYINDDMGTIIYKKKILAGKQYDLSISVAKTPDRDGLYTYRKTISGTGSDTDYVDQGHTREIESILFGKDNDKIHSSR